MVEIALTEASAKFKAYQVDLRNKPEWYAPKVNPASKVLAIAYGGPDVPADDPSPEFVKLAESPVLIEFVANLFPEANLLPKDPVLRAKAWCFIDGVSTEFVPAFYKFVLRGEAYTDLLAAIEVVQDLLPENGGYVLGEQYALGDIAIAPFVARLKVAVMNETGKYPAGRGREFLEEVREAKYTRFSAYARRLLGCLSVQSTFGEENTKYFYVKHFARA